MRKSWPFALAVIIVGALAGLVIAGRPVPSDPFVLDPGITAVAPTSSVAVAPTTSPTSSTSVPITTTIVATTAVPASTSVAATTAAPTTAASTTTETTTTSLPGGPLPRDQVRLVLANGDGRFRLASVTADRIRSLGYIIDLGNTPNLVDATVIYYRPGFDDEAAFAATDIGVPDAIILPFPTNTSQPITDSDARGDIVIVLGPDAPR